MHIERKWDFSEFRQYVMSKIYDAITGGNFEFHVMINADEVPQDIRSGKKSKVFLSHLLPRLRDLGFDYNIEYINGNRLVIESSEWEFIEILMPVAYPFIPKEQHAHKEIIDYILDEIDGDITYGESVTEISNAGEDSGFVSAFGHIDTEVMIQVKTQLEDLGHKVLIVPFSDLDDWESMIITWHPELHKKG